MSTHQNNDGSFSTLADTSRTFEYEWQAQAHEESLNQPSTQQQSAQSYSSPGPGIIAVLIACKPFYPVLMLYWFIAFPAINASWLLRTAGFPFSWLGNIIDRTPSCTFTSDTYAGSCDIYQWCTTQCSCRTRGHQAGTKAPERSYWCAYPGEKAVFPNWQNIRDGATCGASRCGYRRRQIDGPLA